MEIPNSIKKRALDNSLEITIRVGKQGINESLIIELKQQLSKRKLVKMKINQGICSNIQNESVIPKMPRKEKTCFDNLLK